MVIMDDYPVLFTMLANNFFSNPIPTMVVPFDWFIYIYKKYFKRGK